MDCEKALSEGSWTIFGQYLTVQPWTIAFDPTQAYLSVVMAWIRFLALPSYLYNRKIITKIKNLVGKMVKLDMNTDGKTRGRFARLAVYINLEKLLVSQILINGREQKVEYESLSTICFHCGRYGHVENICKFKIVESLVEVNRNSPVTEPVMQNSNVESSEKKDGNFRPWMIVERKSRRKSKDREGKILHVEKEPTAHRSIPNLKEPSRGEAMAGVGRLDSEKHSAVIFRENKEPLHASSFSTPVGIFESGKVEKIKGKISKQNKSLYGSNVRFKNSGSYHVSLKKSMEHLAKSISAFAKKNGGAGIFSKNDGQMEGLINPGQ
ncbi:hypothetical protein J1N35_002019 [Gossypium stocksii]|uniref:CCHC-type domain-containing protein n=1 Tax=Gossypium stocksii TaxID=47602 RepID=A0A9D3WLJ6_9ROSI|nr:hypothetical protein J1N35_002019 [Gossypium stocksii]